MQTSLIRATGEPASAPSAPAPASACTALVVGGASEEAIALTALLRSFGANAEVAATLDEASAALARGAFALLVLADASRADIDAIARQVRLDPRHARAPIVALSPLRDGGGSLAPVSRDRARKAAPGDGVVLVARAPAEVLESQLALAIELHRARLGAADKEEQLARARLELHAALAAQAALAEQVRCAAAELDTAQRQLVQAAKLASLGELVAGVAHELNNPLSFSLSHLGTLRRSVDRCLERVGELEPETREEAARISERLGAVALGLDRIKGLVVKLQTLSRLDDGNNQLVNVAEAIGTVLVILQHRIRDRVHVSTELGAPETIQCQSSLINQCLMNLIVNAIDATEPLEAEGSIHISARAEGDDYVLRVVDNGHGIPADVQARIFDPFFTTKPEGKGTGLGLSIAASVVKKHEGTLELAPAEGGGTQAVARLPLRRVTANVRAAVGAR